MLARGHRNNLNLIRVVAATAVLFSHSYVISSGNPKSEPWESTIGMSPGGVAVSTFFTLSGFLVTGSLLRSRSFRQFALARALRIYPGLWAALVAYTLVVGGWFSNLDFVDFLRHPQTWRYLLRNAVMITGADATLPGAFPNNPIPAQVNFSLWTLRWELRLYLLFGLAWWIGGWTKFARPPASRLEAFRVVVPVLTLILLGSTFLQQYRGHAAEALPVSTMFFCGACCWLHADRIRLRGWAALIIGLGLAGGAALSPLAFDMVFRLGGPYLLMYLAFRIGGPIRRYGNVGDYSYGIYVYACPIQQMIAALVPGISTWALSGVALVAVVAAARISWHFIEEPALRLKQRASTRPVPQIA